MSRIRFHSIKAIFAREDVEGIYTGPGWENWDTKKACNVNINKILGGKDCDLVITYKPLDPGINDFKSVNIRKCIRYNEMYDEEWTMHEIKESGTDLVVCHHYNDYEKYNAKNLNKPKFKWVPHSAEKTIFFPDDQIKKIYDIGIVGAVHTKSVLGSHYPLRQRMFQLIKKLPAKYSYKIFPHVGYEHNDSYTDKYAKQFASYINSCKIVITDSGTTNSRFAKYIEIPMCGTAIAADVYDDHPKDIEEIRKFLIQINNGMSDGKIISILTELIENQKLLNEIIKIGIDYTNNFTQEKYAERFINLIR